MYDIRTHPVLSALVPLGIVALVVLAFMTSTHTPADASADAAPSESAVLTHQLGATRSPEGGAVSHFIVEHPVHRPAPAGSSHPMGGGTGQPERTGSFFEKCTELYSSIDCYPITTQEANELLGR